MYLSNNIYFPLLLISKINVYFLHKTMYLYFLIKHLYDCILLNLWSLLKLNLTSLLFHTLFKFHSTNLLYHPLFFSYPLYIHHRRISQYNYDNLSFYIVVKITKIFTKNLKLLKSFITHIFKVYTIL